MRFVCITDELPQPDAAGHLAMNFCILDWLQAQGHEIRLLLLGSRLAWPVQPYGFARVAGPQVGHAGPYVYARSPGAALKISARAALRRLPAGIAAYLRARRHQADAVLGRFCTEAEADWCARYVAKARPDAVLIDTMFRAPMLARPAFSAINHVVIAHDVFFRRHQALTAAGYAVKPAALTEADEAACLAAAKHIAAIQPQEARLLAAMCPAQNVFCAPMPAKLCPPPADTVRLAQRLVFVGSASLPNLDGLRWFFAEIWPLLAARGISLDLAGDCGAALRHLPKNTVRLGRVASVAPVLHRAALAIAPLRVGSGLKIKLLDYARHGLFTVATPASLEGFAPDGASPFAAAADAGGFAQAILARLETPPAPGLALAYIERHYGIEASFAGLARALALPAQARSANAPSKTSL